MMDAYLCTCAISTSVRDHVWVQCRPATAKQKFTEMERTAALLEANGIDSSFSLGADENTNEDELNGSCDGEIRGDYAPFLKKIMMGPRLSCHLFGSAHYP